MFLTRFISLVGLSCLLLACTTGTYTGGHEIDKNLPSYKGDTTARKGVQYLFGRGVPQSDSTAFSYFQQAAQQGDKYAQNEVAFLYAAGKGTTKNYQQAYFWYQKASKAGLASAQYNLGFLYLHGLGTKTDKTKALYWIRQSAQQGFEPAQSWLATQNA